jgi:hypothetical protein
MEGRSLFWSVSVREECERSEQGKKVIDPIDEPPPLAMFAIWRKAAHWGGREGGKETSEECTKTSLANE